LQSPYVDCPLEKINNLRFCSIKKNCLNAYNKTFF
jgi:hypothetical protein